MSAAFFDRIAGNWDSRNIIDKKKISLALDKAAVNKGSNILDVGTGTGILIPYLQERIGSTGQITAVDSSKNMLKIAKSKYCSENITYLNEDVETADSSSKYDSIILFNMFPHLKDGLGTVKKLSPNNLKNGGKLVIFHSLGRERINKIHKRAGTEVENHKLMSVDSLSAIFKNSNINVLERFENDELYMILIGSKQLNKT
ncbi:demethylmenaquinone methyltransferase / 2-methoxy-6-polyprenyl-1,4-benzoquinol methylase [Dethiosulfatibacter aminovorans DSM 17477]|uniref:Demethylmenaquinone methyltransferase / 2-methoxy-6-polyprenyl-1,4-benzoquinol methylase n=1 Tax=Dethiosulfatibacter aminovorans DSM 17477 TaxID=1121476 RepID=A0A1M6IHJ5_9FIRM|nr:class I SAM-dependent methyltransferase [Dethiosulfatibacter aminovorans]SHJ33898.1 demethylmenaquinone methyltransferase / 2-methoxy-6-polyprenyl-1,4-benzoquinol methylase [Dethiosulfatibacter aminovorans DSM 17477]